jgi:hypothetical protein
VSTAKEDVRRFHLDLPRIPRIDRQAPVLEVLQSLETQRLTGTLRIGAGARVAMIELSRGYIFSAELPGSLSFVDRLLLAGIASREEVSIRDRGTHCARRLIETDPQRKDGLEKICRLHCETIVGEVVGWEAEELEFFLRALNATPVFRFDLTSLLVPALRAS